MSRKRPVRRRVSTNAFYWALGLLFVLAFVAMRILIPAPITLVQATTVGAAHFANGDTKAGGHGQTVDGIGCDAGNTILYHIHTHLSLFYDGQQIAIPMGVGIVPPRQVQANFVVGGKCFYWLHTHDATGIIHVESPVQKQFTLGDFFDIWGQPLRTGDVAGYHGSVVTVVDGKRYSGNPRDIVLGEHEQVTLEVGPPYPFPTAPTYTWPAGL